MSDEISVPDAEATATPESESDQLEQLLTERFGDDFSVDDLDQYSQDRSTWAKQQNRHNQQAAEAAKEAARARDELLQSLTAHQQQAQPPQASQQQAAQNSPDDFFKTLGLTSPDDVMTGRQAYAVWKGASDYMEAANQVYASKFADQEKELTELRASREQFQQTQQAFAQYLADERVNELTEKYPNADRAAIIRSIRETEPGDTFDFQVEQAARESHEHIGRLVGEARERETRRREQSRKPFTGSGESAAAAGKKLPSLGTSEGIAAFMQRFPLDGGGEEPV